MHVEKRLRATLITIARDTCGFPLTRNIGPRDGDLLFKNPNPHISRGDVAQKGNKHIVIGSDRREIGGVGRFDAAPELAPNIDFPGCLHIQRVEPEVSQSIGGAAGAERHRLTHALIS